MKMKKIKGININGGHNIIELKPPLMVNDIVSPWLKEKEASVTKITFETYLSRIKLHISNEIGLFIYDQLNREDIHDWINNKNLANKTKNEILSILRQSFEMAYRDGLIDKNIMERIPLFKIPRKIPQPFTLQEMKSIGLHAAPELDPIVTFFNWTGLTTGELFALRWSDIDLAQSTISITKTLHVEGGSFVENNISSLFRYQRRQVKLFTPALDALRQQKRFNKNSDYIFTNPSTGKPWNVTAFTEKWKKILSNADVTYRRPNNLRITYANLMMGLGGRTEWIIRQMGYSPISQMLELAPSYSEMANYSSESHIEESLQNLNCSTT